MIKLESFRVLKRLTVSNVRLEPKRVRATYSIENYSGHKDQFELIYSYDSNLFDGRDPDDINLASMMTAQAALNYGLFCEIIEFNGLFDTTDKQFITKMMENTSREIICNKLLVKNEFLLAPFNTLSIEYKKRYTQADITFSNTDYSDFVAAPAKTETNKNLYAILSSGGKDSLLSYGIIKEIGVPYPVFINESGRHWFTAVNSFRYFNETEPNTRKPWCNSDRLFNWMLKHLKFIRPDFSNVRADIYPIRLWTVAIFVFGTLPIARKNSIGNILVGNEYDTTYRGITGGISHYNGLYDQSRYFDNMMTAYYKKKGWDINQFSILRSLSELLIMHILIKRYPHLQVHQISCHAAHEVNGRMFPCGNCEKCRRIIGMIKALDENPENCGYSVNQIAKGLSVLENFSVKQLGSDAKQLYYILLSKGQISRNDFTAKMAKEHPEINMLRFDNERSRPEDIPAYIRKPLFDILRTYSEAAVRRSGNKWLKIDIDNDNGFKKYD